MNVAVCRLTLHLPENSSLKGKRQVIQSLKTRVHNRFNVSIAEVDDYELWQKVTLGVCCLSGDSQHANEVISKVFDFIRESLIGQGEITDYETEIFSY